MVWSAGAGGGDPERTYAVDRDAAVRSIDAAQQAGVARYVMVSYYGAGPDHGVAEGAAFYAYAEARAAADAHLRDSALEWVVLGPSALTDGPAGGVSSTLAEQDPDAKGSVSRATVAAVIAAVVERPGLARVTYEFNDGEVPIADALEG